MKARTAILSGLVAVGIGTAIAAPAAAQTAAVVRPASVQAVCAQDVYVRAQPAGVVIGTLLRGDNFDHTRSDPSGEWWYGHAYGNVHQDGWVISSAMIGC